MGQFLTLLSSAPAEPDVYRTGVVIVPKLQRSEMSDVAPLMSKPSVTRTNHLLPFGELSAAQFARLCLWLVEYEGYTRAEHLGEAGSEQGRDVIAHLPTASGEQLW